MRQGCGESRIHGRWPTPGYKDGGESLRGLHGFVIVGLLSCISAEVNS